MPLCARQRHLSARGKGRVVAVASCSCSKVANALIEARIWLWIGGKLRTGVTIKEGAHDIRNGLERLHYCRPSLVEQPAQPTQTDHIHGVLLRVFAPQVRPLVLH